MEQRMVAAQADCPARLVPAGTPVVIPEGSFVTITQALGGNYTVVYNGNMMRVDGMDAEALGLVSEHIDLTNYGDGKVHLEQVHAVLRTIFDPEIPINLLDLGLIYKIDIRDDNSVKIDMTLTAPTCGMGPVMISDVKYRVEKVPNVASVEVELVFDPPWHRDMMSEEAQLEAGLFF